MVEHGESAERPRFRPERGPAKSTGSLALLVGLLLAVAAALAARPLWEPAVPPGVLVEVRGEVPSPGTYLLEEPTLAAAVEAAGGEPEGIAEVPVPPGHRVVVEDGSARVAPPSDPLLVALPVDVNTAEVAALMAIPGVGRTTAEAIVAEREEGGPFRGVDDLTRVSGVGPSTLERLRPFVTAEGAGPPPGPVDLNTADVDALQRLPGIGPVTAARIVVDREDRGPYRRLEDLQRVKGIGPATVEGLREHAVVSPP